MTQIDELLRETANAVERDAEAEHRAIGRAQRALSAAIAAEVAPDRPRANEQRRWGTRLPRRLAGLGLAVAGAAAAAIAVVALGGSAGSGGPASANAAIIDHISAELTAPPGKILHEAATDTPTGLPPGRFELWEQTGATGVYRVIKAGTEASQSATQNETYDPSTHTVTVSPLPPAIHAREVADSGDAAVEIKQMVNSGQATATPTTYDGIPAFEIRVPPSGDPNLNGTAYVARSDYRPLEIDSTNLRIVFSTYEYLPATPANNALLAETTAHPGATVVHQTSSG
ncbi:MAG: hypothetical protein JO304_18395 [Solirubrobacterales bacterium]|nr:hypothetical protein [Solirubrobacterales bacterium]